MSIDTKCLELTRTPRRPIQGIPERRAAPSSAIVVRMTTGVTVVDMRAAVRAQGDSGGAGWLLHPSVDIAHAAAV